MTRAVGTEAPGRPCPACGFAVFAAGHGSADRCPVCGWVDDLLQLAQPDFVIGANSGLSLREAQARALVAHPLTVRRAGAFARHHRWRPLAPDEHPTGGFTLASPVCYMVSPDPETFEPYWLGPSRPHDVAIRPYAREDVPRLFEAVSESKDALAPWLPWCHAGYAAEESRIWVESQVEAFEKRTELAFVVVSGGGRFLGGCGLNAIDRLNRRANLGYWVRTSEAGRGVATRAVRLLSRWAFENTDLERLEIVSASGNAASLRVAEKAGAVREGVLRRRLLLHGTFHDATLFSILRDGGG